MRLKIQLLSDIDENIIKSEFVSKEIKNLNVKRLYELLVDYLKGFNIKEDKKQEG